MSEEKNKPEREAISLPDHNMVSAPPEVLTEELLGRILVYCRDTANPTHADIRATFGITAEIWSDWMKIDGFEKEITRYCQVGIDSLVQAHVQDGLNGNSRAREFLLKHRHDNFRDQEEEAEEDLPRATDTTRRFL